MSISDKKCKKEGVPALLSDCRNASLFLLWKISRSWKDQQILFMPLPVADLFKVLTVLSDVLFVLDEFVVHLLDQVSTLETVNLVLYTHIEWSCNGTLLLIAVNGHVVVVTLIGQLVDQSRISVECEDDRFIFCTISEQVRDFA